METKYFHFEIEIQNKKRLDTSLKNKRKVSEANDKVDIRFSQLSIVSEYSYSNHMQGLFMKPINS